MTWQWQMVYGWKDEYYCNYRFEIVANLKKSILTLDYREEPQDLPRSCSTPSFTKSEVKEFKFANNRFLRQGPYDTPFIDYELQDFYKDDSDKEFLLNTFRMVNNTYDRQCDCNPPPDLDSDPDYKEWLTRDAFNGSRCLSPQDPPQVGLRRDICRGVLPTPLHKDKANLVAGIRSSWVTYLVIAVFVTAILTAIIAVLLTRYFCSGNSSDKRAVSPEAPPAHHQTRFEPS